LPAIKRGGRIVTHQFHLATIVVVLAFAAASSAFAQDKAQIDRGMKVYADQKCATCHSIAGKGNAKGALDDVGSRLKPDEIRAWMVTPVEMTKKTNAARKPPMRAYPNLSKEDLDALVAYMVSLKK
jgi:mono/diheme cytochrome c family protein